MDYIKLGSFCKENGDQGNVKTIHTHLKGLISMLYKAKLELNKKKQSNIIQESKEEMIKTSSKEKKKHIFLEGKTTGP